MRGTRGEVEHLVGLVAAHELQADPRTAGAAAAGVVVQEAAHAGFGLPDSHQQRWLGMAGYVKAKLGKQVAHWYNRQLLLAQQARGRRALVCASSAGLSVLKTGAGFVGVEGIRRRRALARSIQRAAIGIAAHAAANEKPL